MSMDLKEKKLNLIDWLVNLTDETIVEKIYDFKKTVSQDWHEDLPEAAKKSIERGLKDSRDGNIIPHDQVMEGLREKYNIKK